MKDTENCFR